MRRRLILLTVAVTGLVVLAFLVPLSIIVGDLAKDRAIAAGERDAESIARVLSALIAIDDDPESALEAMGDDRIASVGGSVVMPDDTAVGIDVPPDEDLDPARRGSSFAAEVEGGVAVYVPVITGDGPAIVVRVFVSAEEMRSGVPRSRVILGALGLALVAIAAWIADRLGRSMVEPIQELSAKANQLGHGDLSVRVDPGGPPEIEEAGIEFNRLADQIGRLLQAERETAADLAHRLRTPLTAARLSVDGLSEGPDKERLIADLDDLQRTTDFIIREARRPIRREEEVWCDLAVVTSERIDFWLPLAVEQGREVQFDLADEPAGVPLPAGDVEAVVDALLENALSHTDDGTHLNISVEIDRAHGVLCVEDAGQGFVDGSAVERGESMAGSTGLGLDIVRRTVENAGGTLSIGESRALGGAGIVIKLPLTTSN